jgi:hypothetical protein
MRECEDVSARSRSLNTHHERVMSDERNSRDAFRVAAPFTCPDCGDHTIGDHDCPVSGTRYRQTLAGVTAFEEIAKRAIAGDAEAAKEYPRAAQKWLEARGPKVTPVLESWTEGRHVSGTLTFEWLKGDPMPEDARRLQELHMGDTITDGELPNVGECRFRVNRFAMSIDNQTGLRRAEAGIEVLDG